MDGNVTMESIDVLNVLQMDIQFTNHPSWG